MRPSPGRTAVPELLVSGSLALTVLLSACGGPGAEEEEEPESADGEARDSVVTVRTSALELAGLTEVAPRPGRLARTATLVGRLRYDPSRRTVVRAPAAGRFRMGVAPGARVARGDTLGQLASPETYPDSLALTSPLAGRVLDLPAGPEGLVDAWSPVAVVASSDPLRLVVPVPPDRYADVREGTRLTVAPGPGAAAAGRRAARVSGFLEPEEGAVGLRAVARVPNPDGALEPGMRVPVTLRTGETAAGYWLPEESVLYDRRRPDRTVVFLRRGEGYAREPVEVGGRTGDSVFVVSGVDSLDTVVADGSYQLLYADFSFRGIGAEAGELEEGEEDDGGP